MEAVNNLHVIEPQGATPIKALKSVELFDSFPEWRVGVAELYLTYSPVIQVWAVPNTRYK